MIEQTNILPTLEQLMQPEGNGNVRITQLSGQLIHPEDNGKWAPQHYDHRVGYWKDYTKLGKILYRSVRAPHYPVYGPSIPFRYATPKAAYQWLLRNRHLG